MIMSNGLQYIDLVPELEISDRLIFFRSFPVLEHKYRLQQNIDKALGDICHRKGYPLHKKAEKIYRKVNVVVNRRTLNNNYLYFK